MTMCVSPLSCALHDDWSAAPWETSLTPPRWHLPIQFPPSLGCYTLQPLPVSLHGACLSSVASPLSPLLLACCLGKWLWCHYALTLDWLCCCKVKFSEFTKSFSVFSAWLWTLKPWLAKIVCYRITKSIQQFNWFLYSRWYPPSLMRWWVLFTQQVVAGGWAAGGGSFTITQNSACFPVS